MSEKTMSSRTKNAVFIGIACIFSYLVSYYSRNLASVTSPIMLKEGVFTEGFYGILTSVYMVTYASGQLLNGIIGDILNPKKMIFCGLMGTAFSSIAYPFLPENWMRLICYALLGFSLSMLRGPLVKTIAENTSQNHSRVIGTFFSVASLAGPIVASALYGIFGWKWAYAVAGIITCLICVCVMIVITRFERKGVISYRSGKSEGIKGVLSVFKIERFFFYMVVGAVIETGLSCVSVWVPQYLVGRLGFEENVANTIFFTLSVLNGIMPFLTLLLFRLSKEKDVLLMRVFFGFAICFYMGVAFVQSTAVNILFLSLAMMATSCSSALLWSIYIPGLGKTGRVSSINGILDCSGYIGAGISNLAIGFVADSFKVDGQVNWMVIVFIWAAIAVVGLIAALTQKTKKAQ